jgi:hypothetical protein
MQPSSAFVETIVSCIGSISQCTKTRFQFRKVQSLSSQAITSCIASTFQFRIRCCICFALFTCSVETISSFIGRRRPCRRMHFLFKTMYLHEIETISQFIETAFQFNTTPNPCVATLSWCRKTTIPYTDMIHPCKETLFQCVAKLYQCRERYFS